MIVLPASMEEQSRREVTRILQEFAEQINRGATIDIGSATATSTFTISADLTLVDATAGSVTAFLPKAIDWRDRTIHIKKMNANAEAIHIHAQSGETVDETACIAITVQFVCLQIVSNGSNWYIV